MLSSPRNRHSRSNPSSAPTSASAPPVKGLLRILDITRKRKIKNGAEKVCKSRNSFFINALSSFKGSLRLRASVGIARRLTPKWNHGRGECCNAKRRRKAGVSSYLGLSDQASAQARRRRAANAPNPARASGKPAGIGTGATSPTKLSRPTAAEFLKISSNPVTLIGLMSLE